MRRSFAIATLAAALLAFAAAAQRPPDVQRAAGKIAATQWPYVPGSVIAVRVDGFGVPYHLALVGPGSLTGGGLYLIPPHASPGVATLIAGNRSGLAARDIRIGNPPSADSGLLSVVCYDDGLVFHDLRSFSVLGLLATGGAPSDAAIDTLGRIVATDTQGAAVTIATLQPWSVAHVDDVPLGDEVAIDEATHSIFVTNRDLGGKGALTRVSPDGAVTHVSTGETPEGVAIDERRQIVYVANVNDGTIAAVDAGSMRVLRRFHAIARVFSLALSPDGLRIYGISNQSAGSPFAAAGAAVAIDLTGAASHVAARSRNLTFPIGTVLDASTNTLFVTDESLDVVYVLDPRTLRDKHAPLRTCSTPWKPSLDPVDERLYVPCARADAVDVFDAVTLRRIGPAPFATGGYPLAVTVWHPRPTANRYHPR